MARRFYVVDVFAERLYAGNQLAVVVGGYRVRIFTPAWEIAFAGHPILGTAWVVRHHVAPEASGPVRLNLAVGQIPVTFDSLPDGREVAWFLAPPVLLGAVCARERIAVAVGVSPEDIETRAPDSSLCKRPLCEVFL